MIDSPLNNPFFKLLWDFFWMVQEPVNSLGLYGYHWVFMAETLVLGVVASAVYVAYRLLRSLTGRDPDFEYWKYCRRYESTGSHQAAPSPLVYRPAKSILGALLIIFQPLIASALGLSALFMLARLAIDNAANTLFHVDSLRHPLLYLADALLSGLTKVVLQCLIVVAAAYVLWKVMLWAAKTVSILPSYHRLAARLARGRIRRGGRL